MFEHEARSVDSGVDSTALSESYELCSSEARRLFPAFGAGSELLPAEIRRHVLAVTAFACWTDHLADDGAPADRERDLAQWCATSLAEVRRGHSEHPLRRAFVDTMRRFDLDARLLEEFLDSTRADCAAAPAFATYADQRRLLRGVAGTVFELWSALLQPANPQVGRLMSVLAEAGKLADIFEDFPADLAAGRCYLPGEDLDRFGLQVAALRHGEPRAALDELVELQVTRARGLLEHAAPVAGMVGLACQPFVHAMILEVQLQLDEVQVLGARVLTQGVEPMTWSGSARRSTPAELGPVPGHVAVIMDGNRRWAAHHGLSAADGHGSGARSALRLVDSALRLGIRHLSVYAFSTENWNRDREELAALFDNMAAAVTRGAQWLHEAGVRVRWCGRRDRLEDSLAAGLALLESLTSNNTVMSLTVCADYGGRDELVAAARALAAEAAAGLIRPEDIGSQDIARNLYTPGLPDVDLLIRTSGEQRISNFLPWHLAYAEFVFDPTPWPEFGYRHLLAAVAEYTGRQRRFGADLPRPARPKEPTGRVEQVKHLSGAHRV